MHIANPYEICCPGVSRSPIRRISPKYGNKYKKYLYEAGEGHKPPRLRACFVDHLNAESATSASKMESGTSAI